ncbi:MAG: hypothetical protein CMJ62_10825 [Planctomycetaceae bacterium]|nr:hypothetical protein [Planctomycetaceae bacterium]
MWLVLWSVAMLWILATPANLPGAESGERDKSGTRRGVRKASGSQVALIKRLASRVSFQAEGKGLYPARFRILLQANKLGRKSLYINKLYACG